MNPVLFIFKRRGEPQRSHLRGSPLALSVLPACLELVRDEHTAPHHLLLLGRKKTEMVGFCLSLPVLFLLRL